MTATTTTTGAARPRLIRTLNEQLLLERMRSNGPVSRRDLASASGLSKPTVALALTSLERDALVRHAGRRVGGRGRSASLYEIRSDAGFVLGLDVGREFVRGAVTDLTGAVRARRSRPARSSSGTARVRELAALADDLLQDAGVEGKEPLLQTVVGSPGIIEPDGRALQLAPNLPGWERATGATHPPLPSSRGGRASVWGWCSKASSTAAPMGRRARSRSCRSPTASSIRATHAGRAHWSRPPPQLPSSELRGGQERGCVARAACSPRPPPVTSERRRSSPGRPRSSRVRLRRSWRSSILSSLCSAAASAAHPASPRRSVPRSRDCLPSSPTSCPALWARTPSWTAA